jgi:hypothetical protein
MARDHTITIVESKLSDGSKVYAVHIGNVVVEAIDYYQANRMAGLICEAIEKNSNESAEVEDRSE